MGDRGRKSAAALSVRPPSAEVMERPAPPHDLLDEHVEIWRGVVDALPADWFTADNIPLLSQYCRHVVDARRVSELIELATGDPDLCVKDYERLLKMQQRESQIIATLATKMRVSQQSTTNHRGNKEKPKARKPWEG